MYSVILIDDDWETLETIVAYYDWNRMGMELVQTAGDGLSGLRAIMDLKPDIVLIDIRMPGMNGLKVIESAQEAGCHSYFIVISGHADFEYAQTALRLSVNEYLLKPYSPEDLKGAFEKAIAALDQRIPNLVMPHHGLPRSGSDALWYPVDSEKALMDIVFTGEKQDLAPALNDFIQQVFSRNGAEDALACVSMLCSAIVRPLIVRRKSLSMNPIEGIRWGDRDLIKSLYQFLLAILDEAYSLIHAESTMNPAVILAEKHIRAHYAEKLTLDAVAEAVYITPTYLSSLFSKSLGTSFVSYVNQVRIEKAQELLRQSNADQRVIAEQVGFGDGKYFSQVFKRITGSTPHQYRNRMLRYDRDKD